MINYYEEIEKMVYSKFQVKNIENLYMSVVRVNSKYWLDVSEFKYDDTGFHAESKEIIRFYGDSVEDIFNFVSAL